MTMTVFAPLPARVFSRRRAVTLVLLVLVSTTLLGCQPLIEVVQPTSAVATLGPVTALATVAPDQRGVAIMGVDFDPPLEAGQLIATGGVTLLVAVENQGQIVEPSVRVTARLFDANAPARAGDLANETVTVKGLNPGELRVVRFTQVTDLPIREKYKLLIEAAPVPGEEERGTTSRPTTSSCGRLSSDALARVGADKTEGRLSGALLYCEMNML